jgi:hypothetical protein
MQRAHLSNVFCFWQPPGGFRQGADVAVEREASPRRLLVIGLHGGVLGAVDGTMHPAGATLSSHGVRRPLKASGAEAAAAQAAMMSKPERVGDLRRAGRHGQAGDYRNPEGNTVGLFESSD